MGIVINNNLVTPEIAEQLQKICPFGGFDYKDNILSVNGGCKGCKLCVKKGPNGVVTFEEEAAQAEIDKSQWKGIAVFAQMEGDKLHPVVPELLGKAGELSKVINEDVIAVIIGDGVKTAANELLAYGANRVYAYENAAFKDFNLTPFAGAFYDFVTKVKPGSILVGATNLGRCLAPTVAARLGTGLTADCTVLEMKENTDLVQIRPAFGGNIMAQIVTPNNRPQFCTVRYKIFSAPERLANPTGTVTYMDVTDEMLKTKAVVLSKSDKPKLIDISDAEVIVACGRGIKSEADLEMARELAELLDAQLACTRPLIEAGWMNPRQQIGLSGRTVKPKLIITLGISGSVQFAAGMKSSDRIIAINQDPEASIFGIAHVGLVGDIYEIVPQLIAKIKEGK